MRVWAAVSYVEKVAEADGGRSVAQSVSAVVDDLAQSPPLFPHVSVGLFTWEKEKKRTKEIKIKLE